MSLKWSSGCEVLSRAGDISAVVRVRITARLQRTLHSSLERIKTSAIAIAIGDNAEVQYPIHLLSYETNPERVCAESDAHPVRIHYSISENGLIFRATPEETFMQIYFTVPKEIYQNYFARRRIARA
jgi:hypothetical protein